jgi:hypothetical protein
VKLVVLFLDKENMFIKQPLPGELKSLCGRADEAATF